MSASPRHSGRHSAPRRRRIRPLAVAAPAAALATVAVVGGGVALIGPSSVGVLQTAAAPAAPVPSAATSATAEVVIPTEERKVALSRSLSRRTVATRTQQTRWTTAELNLWSGAAGSARQVGEVPDVTKVVATGLRRNDRAQITVGDKTGWVSADYLSADRPPPGISMQPCPDSRVERGLKPQTVKVYRSVCHAFPEVADYGGWAPRTEHDTGNAIDVMVYGNRALGDKIAAWAQQHASELDLFDILWWHRIWTPVRASEGWRTFADRGSATANHMDHVHLGTN